MTREETIEFLWQIIDDIDTASDICKGNLAAYEKMVHKLQAKRWETPIECDGYKLNLGKLTNSKKALTTEIPSEYANININAFNEWMTYKKYKNKGAITKTLNMLNKYNHQTQQDMVDKSIMNEYKGLFEPKQNQPQRSNVNIDAALDNNVFDLIEQKAQQEQGAIDV